jgi:hypothetical protein
MSWFGFVLNSGRFEFEKIPSIAIRIEPTFRIWAIDYPHSMCVIREEPVHEAVLMRLAFLSRNRQPPVVPRGENFGNACTRLCGSVASWSVGREAGAMTQRERISQAAARA